MVANSTGVTGELLVRGTRSSRLEVRLSLESRLLRDRRTAATAATAARPREEMLCSAPRRGGALTGAPEPWLPALGPFRAAGDRAGGGLGVKGEPAVGSAVCDVLAERRRKRRWLLSGVGLLLGGDGHRLPRCGVTWLLGVEGLLEEAEECDAMRARSWAVRGERGEVPQAAWPLLGGSTAPALLAWYSGASVTALLPPPGWAAPPLPFE